MKVLLLGFTKIAYMPYMHFYIEQLKKLSCDVHLVYWKRDSSPDAETPQDVVTHVFDKYQEDSVPLIRKTGSFYGYRKFVLNILREQSFDLIVVLHSTPGVILSDVLIKKFQHRYILDYRDVTYEHFSIYKKIVHSLVENAITTFVSSDAFRIYLPNLSNIYTSHNILWDSLCMRNIRRFEKRDTSPIRIRYWGLIRHRDINVCIIDRLGNDKRFELHYHGRSQKAGRLLSEYCADKGFNNVFFHGEYKPHERYDFISRTDLIHNIFENDKTMKPAMSNKFYDGLTFYIPQLCSTGSFMGMQVTRQQFGMELDPSSECFANSVYDYYNSINWVDFESQCDHNLERIIVEYNKGIEVIGQIVGTKEEHRV